MFDCQAAVAALQVSQNASEARCTVLVVRRKRGESLLLGGSVLVTVSLVSEKFVELTVSPSTALPYCVTVSMESLRPILPGVSAIAIRIDFNSARMAFDIPDGMTLERFEALSESH